jgi:hypothetical protein
MKKAIFLNLIIWLILSACADQKSKGPQGTWQMVQMQMVEGSKVTNYFSDRYSVNQIKMWSDNHFIFVGKYRVDTTTSYRYGVGTYTLNGNLYTENILYHFDKYYEGTKNKIWLEIKKDTLLHIFPVDDLGKPNQTKHWVEKYVRLK